MSDFEILQKYSDWMYKYLAKIDEDIILTHGKFLSKKLKAKRPNKRYAKLHITGPVMIITLEDWPNDISSKFLEKVCSYKGIKVTRQTLSVYNNSIELEIKVR